MQDEFFKVYRSFFTGTIAEEDPETRIVFLACLDMSDSNGFFTATPLAIQRHANVTPEASARALQRLQAADPDSTSPDDEGRRLMLVSANKWKVVNYAAYRAKSSAEDRRLYMRELMRKRRAKGGQQVQNEDFDGAVSNVSTPVSNVRVNKRKESKVKESKEYSSHFLAFQAEYPERAGGDGWNQATAEAFDAIVKAGTAPEVIVEGAKRYAAECKRTKQTGTVFVFSPENFLDPKKERWIQTYGKRKARKPENNVDFWLKTVGVFEYGELVPPGYEPTEDDVILSEVHKYWIRSGERTNEPFTDEAWREEQN